MIRTLFVVLVLAVCANAHLRRAVETPREAAGVLSAGPSLPVKYVQSSVEEEAEPEEDYVIPMYKAAAVEKPNPSVTTGFCKQMLQDVKDKKAPYFLEGKFTGESRTELVKQCGQRICTWGKEIAAASAPDCKENCPETCNKPKDFVTAMLDDEDKLAAFIGSLLKQFPTGAAKAAPHNALRFKGVTKEFCEHILEKVKAKEAPYWIVNHETGVPEPTEETRSGIVHTCSKKVCDFMDQYKELTKVTKCGEGALQSLANGRHLLPLLEKIVKVIKKQPEPEAPKEEEEDDDEEEEKKDEDLITANDPRDPDFDGGRDGATGMTGAEGEDEEAQEEEADDEEGPEEDE